jgi:hypothetical protein
MVVRYGKDPITPAGRLHPVRLALGFCGPRYCCATRLKEVLRQECPKALSNLWCHPFHPGGRIHDGMQGSEV